MSVLAYAAKPLGPTPEPELLAEAETDLAGTCRATALAAGQYTLRIRIAGSRSWLDRPISLVAGEELQIDVALASITVTGTAKQGSEPLSGFAVSFVDLDDIKPNGTRRDAPAEAFTEEDGSYETVLRAPGNYAVSLLAPNGAPAASQRLWLSAAEETVDFSLEEYGVGGIVVDDDEQPVEGATLMLGWNGYYRVAHTDSKGAFLFPLSDAGAGRLQASKPGYLAPPPVDVSSKPGEPPPPLMLRMKRAGVLKGTVVAHGPAAGASLRSTGLEPGGAMTFLGLARADATGRFEIPASEMGMTRVFVTGAGCPLTTFDFLPTGNEVEVQCPERPASVALYFSDTRGLPVAGKSVLLRRGGVVVPIEMLSEHLAGLRLSAASDANGRLLLVALAPGAYDFFLTDLTNTTLIAQGNPRGLLASSQLDPFSTTEIQVTIESAP